MNKEIVLKIYTQESEKKLVYETDIIEIYKKATYIVNPEKPNKSLN